MGLFDNKIVVFIAMLTVAIATLAMNIAANVVSPANDFSNALPRFISFRTGALITAILGIAMQPWNLMADPSQYIFRWLVGYSGGLGSIAGVLIIDYWIIKKRKLNLQDLYLNKGAYKYVGGWNFAAVAATLLGCAAAWGGLIINEMKPLFDYGWFVGFFVAAISYMMFMPTPKAEGHHMSH
jgi:NCS1 family nucleobase:cation symporter-1